jgi:hypothetical protein
MRPCWRSTLDRLSAGNSGDVLSDLPVHRCKDWIGNVGRLLLTATTWVRHAVHRFLRPAFLRGDR